jgi:hypothetical protein
MIQTFSYPANKAEIIEKATKMARADGISFSEFLISLVEEEVRKKAVGLENPIGFLYNIYNNHKQKPLQTDLTQWLEHVDTVNNHQELNIILGQASAILNKVNKRSMELRKLGIRT